MLSTAQFLTLLLLVDTAIWIVAVTAGETPATFMGEGRLISFVSGAHLIAASVVAFLVFQTRKASDTGDKHIRRSFCLWFFIALGFAYLTVDELAQIHEALDHLIHHVFHIRQNHWSDRLDDLIVLLYGVGGILLLYGYRLEWTRFQGFRRYLVAGFAIFLAMVGVDIITDRPDIVSMFIHGKSHYTPVMKWLAAVEEGLKILGEVFFLAGFYRCLYYLRHRQGIPSAGQVQ